MCLALVGRLLSIHDDPPPDAPAGSIDDVGPDLWRWGRVDFGGVQQPVSLALVPEAQVGDRLLVHVGVALVLLEDAP